MSKSISESQYFSGIRIGCHSLAGDKARTLKTMFFHNNLFCFKISVSGAKFVSFGRQSIFVVKLKK